MPLRRILPLLAVLFFAVACGRGTGAALAPEQEDADFVRAQDLRKRGLVPEALSAYLKVISRRGESAPESHLEAGLIYFQDLKDPMKATIHLQQYLELQPNSPRRDSVQLAAKAAQREWLFQSLAQAQFGGGELAQQQSQIDQLTRENARLEAELKALREAPNGIFTRSEFPLTAPAGTTNQIQVGPAAGSASSAGQINFGQAPPTPMIVLPTLGATKANGPAETKGAATAPTNARGSTPPPKTGPNSKTGSSATAGQYHTVRAGDTLVSIARQYYNGDFSASRIKALTDANRDVLKNGTNLSIGMKLTIP